METMKEDVQRKLGRFEEEVMSSVDRICREIDEDVESYRSSELGKQEEDTLAETYKIIQAEVAHISAERTKTLSRKKMELKKKLYEKRDEYTKLIFAEARLQLAEFASGPEYGAFLAAKVEKLLAGRDLDGAELRLRPADLAFERQLRAVCGALPIAADENIQLGGARLVNKRKNYVADETLDTALEDQKEWFAGNSGFIVTM